MKGTATVTTDLVTPVFVTQVRKGRVEDQAARDIQDDQVRGSFTQDQLDKRGIEIIRTAVIRIAQLREGDELTATIISAEPTVVTETDCRRRPPLARRCGGRNKRNPKPNPRRCKWRRQMHRNPPPHPRPPLSHPPSSPHRRPANRLAWGRCGGC